MGGPGNWRHIRKIFRHDKSSEKEHAEVMTVVYACMSMSKSKTGALIVFQRKVPLTDFGRKTGDEIDADINARLIENIFFKNSPLHDGAMIIAGHRIASVGCILPVSHDMNIPKIFGLRYRAALGMSQQTDAVCVIVSEETEGISVAENGRIRTRLSSMDLEHILGTSLSPGYRVNKAVPLSSN